jgi:hypothetical protein
MLAPVDTRNVAAVEAAVEALYRSMFPGADASIIPRIFACVTQCFRGHCHGYLAIDARYHDLEHTLQGALCMTRLLDGRHRARVEPILEPHAFELGLLAILLHDSGYAKRMDDTAGTGAKYTFTHVTRSAQFATDLLQEHHFSPDDILAVQHMIRCTGVHSELASIPFCRPIERVLGYALGTADYLGQMAAPDYIDKLPFLFEEFQEAAAFSGTLTPPSAVFPSVDDLVRRTPAFWRHYVQPKLEHDFAGVHHFLEDPYPGGPNPYVEAIEANIARIRAQWPGAA